MSIVTLPRRVEHRVPRSTSSSTPRTAHVKPRTGLRRRLALRSRTSKVSTIIGVTLMILLAGNSYVAQRQVDIHRLQNDVLTLQSNYAVQVASLTNTAAPAKVAAQAGHLHLVVPSLVTQISTVNLQVVLTNPKITGAYSLSSRTYQ